MLLEKKGSQDKWCCYKLLGSKGWWQRSSKKLVG